MSYYSDYDVHIEDLDAKLCQEVATVIDIRAAGVIRRGGKNPMYRKRTVFQDAAEVIFQTILEQARRGPANAPPPHYEVDDEFDWTWAE